MTRHHHRRRPPGRSSLLGGLTVAAGARAAAAAGRWTTSAPARRRRAAAWRLFTFVGVGLLVDGRIGLPELVLRGLGTCGLILLHVVLCVGPLARLDRRFLPLVYNRRHLGVATFLVGSPDAVVAIGYYHGFGGSTPLVSLLSIPGTVPFEWLGLAGLGILFVMAATSHDFWQKTLGPAPGNGCTCSSTRSTGCWCARLARRALLRD